MKMPSKDRIFKVSGEDEFRCLAMDVFRYQAGENPLYNRYIRMLGKAPESVREPEEIPFFPVEFFREHRVITGKGEPQLVFESSGTTSSRASRHFVLEEEIYRESYLRGFRLFFGSPSDYCILALMPSYPDRMHSSLVYMAGGLIRLSGQTGGGFYLDRPGELLECIRELEDSGRRYLLLGLSFALADLAESHPMKLKHAMVMETGGMKGHRKEMTREELHGLLKQAFGLSRVYSEYGMTELLSQAWSTADGIFHCPPWMRIMIRDPYDPLSPMSRESSGGINIIDLANIRSCSFIATQDIGRLTPDGGFEVLGRFDSSDIRGCNLMVG
jgi:hypothetical protein